MGAVYEVEHVQLGVHYALKTFTLEEGHVETLKSKFLAEGKVLARLRNPNLVHVFDLNFDEKAGILYFVMDLVLSEDGNPHAFGFYDMLGNVWEWMDCEDLTIGCRHGCSFYDPVGDCTVKKGFHTKRSGRYECCGLRLAARVRPVAAERTDSAVNR